MRKISILHPTRHRHEQALKTCSNWLSKADDADSIEYIFSTDSDDKFPLKSFVNPNKSAIEAINKAAEISTGDLLIVVSDDTDCPEHWDALLLKELDGKEDFLVKTRDGIQPVLITMPVMDRKYYERFGYIYFSGYKHMYADSEMTSVGHLLGRVITSNLLFDHLHYSTGKSPKDAINDKNDTTYSHGEALFNERLKNNFGIENPVIKYEDIIWQPNQVKLSILIATMPSRAGYLFRLAGILTPQLTDDVEVVIDCSMEYNIGTKRNKLLEIAKGDYIAYIDDDDTVSIDYVSKILGALGADCIGISGVITSNGSNARQWHISKEYMHWHEKDGTYLRTPNHISPVKRELALKAGFPEIASGEDAEYSLRLFPLLKTENKIEGNIYWYDYKSK